MTGGDGQFDDGDLTRDRFLGGRVTLWQPKAGYRAGIDPVLLAASVPAVQGDRVLDLGCGAGAAALCLGARVGGLSLAGVEVQPRYAALARRNAQANGQRFDVWCADLASLPGELKQRNFDHVIANPPYFPPGGHSPSPDPGRALALGGDTGLRDWIAVAARRLAPRGCLHVIQRTDRLPELLSAIEDRLGSPEVLPLTARAGRDPGLVILRARKGGRARFVLHAPAVLHQGDRHSQDGDDYGPEISAVLRDAAPLPWPGSG